MALRAVIFKVRSRSSRETLRLSQDMPRVYPNSFSNASQALLVILPTLLSVQTGSQPW